MAFPPHSIKTVHLHWVANDITISKSMMMLSPNLLLSPYHSTPGTLAALLFLAHAKHTSSILWFGFVCSFCLEYSPSRCLHGQLPPSFNLYSNVIFPMGSIMTTLFTIATTLPSWHSRSYIFCSTFPPTAFSTSNILLIAYLLCALLIVSSYRISWGWDLILYTNAENRV